MKHVQTREAAERTGVFLAVDGCELRVADGEVARSHGETERRPVGSAFVGEHDAVGGTVHRL